VDGSQTSSAYAIVNVVYFDVCLTLDIAINLVKSSQTPQLLSQWRRFQ
jgi:hypothetical protein